MHACTCGSVSSIWNLIFYTGNVLCFVFNVAEKATRIILIAQDVLEVDIRG